jgi:hypothetical protein
VIRRRLTIKRLDPWSVLKFGALANVVLLAIFLLMMGVVWFIVDRLQLVDQACGIATDVGFTSCGVNAGTLFRALLLLGLLWVVVQTAVLVFLAFLHNLIADLTGGLVLGVIEDGVVARPPDRGHTASTASSSPTNGGPAGFGSGPGRAAPSAPPTAPQQPVEPLARGSSRFQESEDLFGET